MSDETPELSRLAAALQSLKPAAAIERDQLMYEAGRAAAQGSRFWPAVTAASLLLAVGLLSARWLETPTERVVHVGAPAPQPGPELPEPTIEPRDEAASTLAYLSLRQRVLREGVDSLPPPAAGSALRPVGLNELLNR